MNDEILDITTDIQELSIGEEIIIYDLVSVINEVKVELWGFNYDKQKKPKPGDDTRPPRVLVFGGWEHQNTGNNLVCGTNLNKLDDSEIKKLSAAIPLIPNWENLNIHDKYWSLVAMGTDIAKIIRKSYRTYIEPRIIGHKEIKEIDLMAPEGPSEEPETRKPQAAPPAKAAAPKPQRLPEKPIETPQAPVPPQPAAAQPPQPKPEVPEKPVQPPQPQVAPEQPEEPQSPKLSPSEIDLLRRMEEPTTEVDAELARLHQLEEPAPEGTEDFEASITPEPAVEVEQLKKLEELEQLKELEAAEQPEQPKAPETKAPEPPKQPPKNSPDADYEARIKAAMRRSARGR